MRGTQGLVGAGGGAAAQRRGRDGAFPRRWGWWGVRERGRGPRWQVRLRGCVGGWGVDGRAEDRGGGGEQARATVRAGCLTAARGPHRLRNLARVLRARRAAVRVCGLAGRTTSRVVPDYGGPGVRRGRTVLGGEDEAGCTLRCGTAVGCARVESREGAVHPTAVSWGARGGAGVRLGLGAVRGGVPPGWRRGAGRSGRGRGRCDPRGDAARAFVLSLRPAPAARPCETGVGQRERGGREAVSGESRSTALAAPFDGPVRRSWHAGPGRAARVHGQGAGVPYWGSREVLAVRQRRAAHRTADSPHPPWGAPLHPSFRGSQAAPHHSLQSVDNYGRMKNPATLSGDEISAKQENPQTSGSTDQRPSGLTTRSVTSRLGPQLRHRAAWAPDNAPASKTRTAWATAPPEDPHHLTASRRQGPQLHGGPSRRAYAPGPRTRTRPRPGPAPAPDPATRLRPGPRDPPAPRTPRPACAPDPATRLRPESHDPSAPRASGPAYSPPPPKPPPITRS